MAVSVATGLPGQPASCPGRHVMTSGVLGGAGDQPPLAELTDTLSWLPVASLLLAEDGSALGVNHAWVALSGLQLKDSLGDGWLAAIESLDRIALRVRLRRAAAAGRAGSEDIRLAHAGGTQWSRWWWRPGPARRIVACVVSLSDDELDGHQPEGVVRDPGPVRSQGRIDRLQGARSETDPSAPAILAAISGAGQSQGPARHADPGPAANADADLAQMVVYRLFGVGLTIESALGVADRRGKQWLQEAVDELDSLIRDIRTTIFRGGTWHRSDG